jgi:hypothetical protein
MTTLTNNYPRYELWSAANERVTNSPELAPHRFYLMEYEWDNDTDHLRWVLTAPVAEIVSWAESIETD